MPPDVQERAEAADRAVILVIHLILLAVVVSVLNRSLISKFAVGLTTANWKSAVALGALLSYVPASLSAMLQRVPATDKLGEEPESSGPLAIWCGLTVLSALSVELWRAFCIAGLIRLDLSAWVAVLVAAVAYGASQLTTSIARAAGAAVFGGVVGFLFIKTGSLLAPLTMSLVTMGAHLYQARHRPSQATSVVKPLKCPVCSQTIRWLESPSGKYFPCPGCGQKIRRNLSWTGQGVVCGIVGAGATVLIFGLDLFWSLVLFAPLFILFAFVSSIFASLSPSFRTIEIYHDPHDPKDRQIFLF